MSIDRLLKNPSLLGMDKNPTTSLHNDTTKREIFFEKKETVKNVKIMKRSLCQFL